MPVMDTQLIAMLLAGVCLVGYLAKRRSRLSREE